MSKDKGIPLPKKRGREITADRLIDDLSTVKTMINGDVIVFTSLRAKWRTVETNEKWRADNFYSFVDFVKLKSKQYLGGYDKDLVDMKDPVVDKIVSEDREYEGEVVVTFSATLKTGNNARRVTQ
tara:strand:+ start:129 stop:503 length:375 start_codon:yes stop_codon:yes gene_type:complete